MKNHSYNGCLTPMQELCSSECTSMSSVQTTSSFHGLSSLVSSNIVRRALERKLSSSTTTSALRSHGGGGGGWRKLGSPAVATVALVCSMYHTAVTTLSQLRMDILTGIVSYNMYLVSILWGKLSVIN